MAAKVQFTAGSVFFLISLLLEKFVLADAFDAAGSGAPPAHSSRHYPGQAAKQRRSGIHA
jgi:hypothetical protein